MRRTLLVAVASFAALSSAKLDYGACPTPIAQTTFDASLSGEYYLQYYDNFFDYVMFIADFLYKLKNFDCLKLKTTIQQSTYDRDAQPLKKRLVQPYIVYQDPTKNAIVAYYCVDSRVLTDIVAMGLEFPPWAWDYWNKFLEIFQVWHLKLMAFGTKTPTIDSAVFDSVSTYINTFPYKKQFPYQFPKDFS